MERVVARKVRYMRGRKFFCLASGGLDWTRRMASSAMTISFRRPWITSGGYHPDQRKFLSSGSRPGGNEEPARIDHAVRRGVAPAKRCHPEAPDGEGPLNIWLRVRTRLCDQYRYVRSFACAREDGLIDTSFAALRILPGYRMKSFDPG